MPNDAAPYRSARRRRRIDLLDNGYRLRKSAMISGRRCRERSATTTFVPIDVTDDDSVAAARTKSKTQQVDSTS
jgi:hypothetical protein